MDDYSPNGSDDGYDVLMAYSEWRAHNAPEREKEFFDRLIMGWGINNINRGDEVLAAMLDDALIALAFAKIKLDGDCSEWSATNALQAIARRRQFASDYRHQIFDKLQNKLLMFAPDYKEDVGLGLHTEENEEIEDLLEQHNLEHHGQDAASKGKSKAKVSLKNIDPNGPVYVDARLSKGGRTFNSLPRVDGFPRWIFQNETVEIEMGDNTEILYQRATNEFDQELSADQFEFGCLYRVGNPRGVEIKSYLTEGIRRTLQEIEEIREFHKNYPGHNADCDDPDCDDPEHNSFDEKWIARLRYESSRYIIEPFAKKIGRLEPLLFVRAMDKKTGKSGHRLIVETDHDLAAVLLKKIEQKKGMVKILLNPMHSSLYTSRGFSHTLEVPIDLILDGELDGTT